MAKVFCLRRRQKTFAVTIYQVTRGFAAKDFIWSACILRVRTRAQNARRPNIISRGNNLLNKYFRHSPKSSPSNAIFKKLNRCNTAFYFFIPSFFSLGPGGTKACHLDFFGTPVSPTFALYMICNPSGALWKQEGSGKSRPSCPFQNTAAPGAKKTFPGNCKDKIFGYFCVKACRSKIRCDERPFFS